MSLQKIAAHKKRKRNYYDGGGGGDYAGPDDNGGYQGGGSNVGANADPEGTADAARPDGSAGVENQGGFGGPNAAMSLAEQLAEYGRGRVAAEQAAGYGAGATPNFVGTMTSKYNALTPAARAMAPGVVGLAGVLGNLLTGAGFGTNTGGATGIVQGTSENYRGFGGGDNYSSSGDDHRDDMGATGNANPGTTPFGSDTPAQTTTLPGSTGARRYVWDPKLRQYVLANVGAQDNPMGYSQGQTFNMAAGGPVPASGLGAAGQARFMRGGGTGLSDSIPVQMDDGGQGRLGDGEFVIPADIVSGLGGGSSEAGARALYEMIDRVRQQAHGSTEQIKPVDRSAMAA